MKKNIILLILIQIICATQQNRLLTLINLIVLLLIGCLSSKKNYPQILILIITFCITTLTTYTLLNTPIIPPSPLITRTFTHLTPLKSSHPQKKRYSAYDTIEKKKIILHVKKGPAIPDQSTLIAKGHYTPIPPPSNPGQFNTPKFLKSIKIYGKFDVQECLNILTGNPSIFHKIAIPIRNRIIQNIQRDIPPPYDALLFGLVFGDRGTPLPIQIEEKYAFVGLIHLLVVSGSQIALIATLTLGLLKKITPNKWIQWLCLTLINVVFYLITGGGPSILRAMLMVSVYQLLDACEYNASPPHTLAFVASIMCIPNPLILYNRGFQLSFLATSSLLFLRPLLISRLTSYGPKPLANMLGTCLAPFLLTTPLIWYLQDHISILSLLSNLLACFWIEIIVVVGFAASISALLHIPIFLILHNACLGLMITLDKLVQWLQKLNWLIITCPAPHISLLIGLYVWIIIIIWGNWATKHHLRIGLLFGFVYLIPIILQALPSDPTITALDVGQGDCMVIKTKHQNIIMIDTGNAFSKHLPPIFSGIIRPYLKHQNIQKVDLLILTHFDQDHIANTSKILEHYPVKTLIHNGNLHHYPKLIQSLQKHPPNQIIAIQSPSQITVDPDTKLNFLQPQHLNHIFPKSKNNQSLMIQISLSNHKLLITGDSESEREHLTLAQFPDQLNTDILQVGHHGSKSSSTPPFINTVSPSFAIISCGKQNRYRHPHPQTLQTLQNHPNTHLTLTPLSGATRYTIKTSIQRNTYYQIKENGL